MALEDIEYDAPRPRHIGIVNWRGVYTHYQREVHRFWKIAFQTLVAPIITTLLFLAVFSLALGRAVTTVGGVPFMEFLAPGLIMMTVVQNAFANTSTSVMIAKVQGNIVDVLMPPLSPAELVFGYVMGGASRGIAVGVVVAIAMSFFVEMSIHNIWLIIFHLVAASLALSTVGVITGILSEKFDHLASFTNFIITPLSFLSGTFYSVQRLPETWQAIAYVDPIFYMIDGFRYGFTGNSDSPLWLGIVVLVGLNVALWSFCHLLFAKGYRLKA